MTQGFDRNLQVLTASAFEKIYQKAASLNIADPMARLLLRLFLGSAVELQQTRSSLAIPENLKEYAGLRQGVLLIGQGDYFEIWAAEQWDQQEIQLRDTEANASRFAALSLSPRQAPTDPVN